MIWLERYKGWLIRGYWQHHKDYLPCVAMAEMQVGSKLLMFNRDGRTIAEAVALVKLHISPKE